MVSLNLLIIQSIKNWKKNPLSEIYTFRYKKLKKWKKNLSAKKEFNFFFSKSKYLNPIQNNRTRTKNTRIGPKIQKYLNGFYTLYRDTWKSEILDPNPNGYSNSHTYYFHLEWNGHNARFNYMMGWNGFPFLLK